MIILEEPYVSQLLINYLERSKTPVLKNLFSEQYKQLNLTSETDFIKQYKTTNNKIYTSTEYALDWLVLKLNDKNLNRQIELLKNKTLFRNTLQNIYPNFTYRDINYSELFTVNTAELKYPFVLKPSVGFLSAGVYTVFNTDDWQNTLSEIQKNFKTLAQKFPDTVVGNNTFIIEQYIGGTEYAIDVYFKNKKPVIINIFEHPFVSPKDVSDRLYITGKKIFDKYLNTFTQYVTQLNTALNLDNIPVHIELRIDNNKIYPIEINPIRFTGLCLNEINYYITGKHPLEFYFTNITPDYNNMWEGKEEDIFCFSIIEKNKSATQPFAINTVTQQYSNILELRQVNNPHLDIEAFIFSKTHSNAELENILKLKI